MKRLARALAIGLVATLSATGCGKSKADMPEGAHTDINTLAKLVTLDPVPAAARWSSTPIGKDEMFGPSDTTLWAVLRYPDADFARISRALEADGALPAGTGGTPPGWLLANVDLSRYRHGPEPVLTGPVFAATPFASGPYPTGFALVLPDRRVVIHLSSR